MNRPARCSLRRLSFDVSFQELFTTWAQGGTVVLVDEELRRDLPRLAKFIADRRYRAGVFTLRRPAAAGRQRRDFRADL